MSSTPCGAFQLQAPEPVEPFEHTLLLARRAVEASPPARLPLPARARADGLRRTDRRHSCGTTCARPRRFGRRRRRGQRSTIVAGQVGPDRLQRSGRIGRAGRSEGDVDAESDDDGEGPVRAESGALRAAGRRPWRRRAARSFGHFRERRGAPIPVTSSTASCRASPATKPSCGATATSHGSIRSRLA